MANRRREGESRVGRNGAKDIQKPRQVRRQMDTEKSTTRLETQKLNPLDDTEVRSEGRERKRKEQGCLLSEYKSSV